MLEDILEKIDNLPPLPQTITEIEEFRKRAEKDADDLLKIIEKDALIISTLLKVSNSVIFGFRTKIETPKRIISLLGINFTIFIAINETVQNMLKTDLAPYKITNEEFMEASSMSSILANLWLSKVDTELKEDILLPALLQEAGKFILSELLIMKNKSTDFINQQQNDKDIVEIEKEILETIESDAEITTLIVDCLYRNNLVKLEELGFSCENIGEISYNGYYYEISWAK